MAALWRLNMRETLALTAIGAAVFALTALPIGAGALMMSARPAQATPNYTQQTGKPCGFCHVRGPDLNGNGKRFRANGNRF